jgi:nucleotide-binding universal stress UspA family protein
MEMLLNKILLPVDFPNTELRLFHQAASLARHSHSEILLLHVVTPLSYPAGVLASGDELTQRDLQGEIVKWAQRELDQSLRPEPDRIVVKRLLLRGDPAREIVQTAQRKSGPDHDVHTWPWDLLSLSAGLGGGESVT